MKVQIDLTKLNKEQITANEYLFLYLASIGQASTPDVFGDINLEKLQEKGFLKVTAEAFILRGKALNLVGRTAQGVDAWIDEWRDLWPTGVRSGGRPIRGNKSDCLKKMIGFIESTEYTKEEIMAATLAYVIEKKHADYKFMISADYFIRKDGCSVLESWCEDMKTRGGKVENFEKPSFNESV
jgi:hypothetical protein